MLRIRFDALPCNALAYRMGLSRAPFCRVCSRGCVPGPRTAGPWETAPHILGACRPFQAHYTARHNAAVLRIFDAIRLGPRGGMFAIVDGGRVPAPAGAGHRFASHPFGSFGSRIPTWLLPDVPPNTLKRMRPDILIVDGLTLPQAQEIDALHRSDPPAAQARLAALRIARPPAVVHVLEVAYASPGQPAARALARKQQQHRKLIAALQASHYTVHAGHPTVILLGTDGTIYDGLRTACDLLEVTKPAYDALAKRLHTAALASAHSLVQQHDAKARAHAGRAPPRPASQLTGPSLPVLAPLPDAGDPFLPVPPAQPLGLFASGAPYEPP
jgi:hypothetical protein